MDTSTDRTGVETSVTTERRSGIRTRAPKPATEIEIRESVRAVRQALEGRSWRSPNIWVFYSNKNRQLIEVAGDLNFVLCVLFEADHEVASYRVVSHARSPGRSPSDHIVVVTTTGTTRTYAGASGNQRRRKLDDVQGGSGIPSPGGLVGSIPESGTDILVSESQLVPRMAEFANWLLLSGAMTRARDFSTAHETECLLNVLENQGRVRLGDALSVPNTDPALMLAAIAKGLMWGGLSCDTTSERLGLDTLVEPSSGRSRPASAPQWLPQGAGATPVNRVSVRPNRRTRGHPELQADPELWTVSDGAELEINSEQRRRSKAVLLYLQDRPYAEITQETGIGASWVRKLFRRTLQPGNDGRPLGLRALGRYQHLGSYVRRCGLPRSNLADGRHGGYAGAFSCLMAQFPGELLALIEGEVLKRRRDQLTKEPRLRLARVSWIDLHGEIKKFLRGKGIDDGQYPFNTRDQGYSSLVTLCNALLFKRPIRWIESRGGMDAAHRAHLGTGKSSLIGAQWMGQIVELDYQKVDSAAIVDVASPKGTVIGVPVARWWSGAIVECYSDAIVATSDSFELQTTEDCLMELVDQAVALPARLERLKRFRECPDGGWLPGHALPAFAGQAWDILKIDGAWAHKSTTAISAIIATVGCAVCYGAPRAWFARYLGEHTFEKLTQAGPQKLPTTYGSGPIDTRKQNPEQQAVSLHFLQDDICDLIKASARWLNETGDEGVFWAAPLVAMKAAAADPDRRFFPRPIPLARQMDRPLMWHTIPCTFEGNAVKGVAPRARVHRTRFRGPVLSRSWHLIKQHGYLQVYRRDIRVARVLAAAGSEIVDWVTPERKWMSTAVSWRDHELIQRFGRMQKHHGREPPPAENFLEVKQAELSGTKPAKGRTNAGARKRDATAVGRIMRNAARQSLGTPEVAAAPVQMRPVFGGAGAEDLLGPAPTPGGLTRGRGRG